MLDIRFFRFFFNLKLTIFFTYTYIKEFLQKQM